MQKSNPPKKKGFFGRLFTSFKSGATDSGAKIKDGAGLVSDLVVDSRSWVWEGVNDSVKWAIKGASKKGEMVIDKATGTVGYIKNGIYYVGGKAAKGTVTMTEGVLSVGGEVVGTVRNGVYYVGDKSMEGAVTVRDGVYYVGDKAIKGSVIAKDSVMSVGDKVVGTLINTTRFVSDSEYRQLVGMPWLKGVVNENREIISYQMQKNKDSMDVVYRYSFGKGLEPGELEEAKKQMIELIKIVPAFAIFMLPGGMVLLPLLGKILPWEVIPDIKPPKENQENTKEA